MTKGKKKPELKVVFDTNVIYSGSASYLVNIELAELIKTNMSYHDLEISWHLPETVIMEREFQMIKKGIEFLEPVRKLEDLLGHKLNITEEIFSERVKCAIIKQMDDISLTKINLITEKINWNSLINKALKRVPPFEDNKNEKGFRDSLILEAFDQLVQSSSKTSSSCRIAFVCNDSLLMEAVKERTKGSNNIRYLKDLTSLKGLINILVSEIEETLINEISNIATELFFIPENRDTLYFKEDVRKTINDKFWGNLHKLPDLIATKVEIVIWFISPVNFVKKEKQRIWWSSAINIKLKAYKNGYDNTISRNLAEGNKIFSNYPLIKNLTGDTSTYLQTLQNFSSIPRDMLNSSEPIEYLNGNSKYEVIWSVTYTANKKFLKPAIEEIKYIGNEWGND